jgi:hypothetical protein
MSNRPGGCVRYGLGPGLTGYCYEICNSVGPGSCPPLAGSARRCIVLDERSVSDPNAASNDKFVGGLCVYSDVPNATGTPCVDRNGGYSLNACVDGDECYVDFLGGDNLCHPLCVEGGTGDGGTPNCVSPATCHDLWGLFGTAKPFGLCY